MLVWVIMFRRFSVLEYTMILDCVLLCREVSGEYRRKREVSQVKSGTDSTKGSEQLVF